MHDPSTLAFEIKSPIKRRSEYFPEGYRETILRIWHNDPEKDGSDDSCGWSMRVRHGDSKTLERIIKAFESDWDRVYEPNADAEDQDDLPYPTAGKRIYDMGFFYAVDRGAGAPRMSVHGIALNLFLIAAGWHFAKDGQPDWDKGRSFIQKHLAEILLFAENPTDSLYESFMRTFANGCNEPYTKRHRDERLEQTAVMIYGWILRKSRPWWRHPKYHVHHWSVQIPAWQNLRRWLFTRCRVCGKRFRYGECPVSDSWNAPKLRWFRGETHLRHDHCDGGAYKKENVTNGPHS